MCNCSARNYKNRTVVSLTTTWQAAFISPQTRTGVFLYNPSTASANMAYRILGPGEAAPSGVVDLTGTTASLMPDGEIIPGQSVELMLANSVNVYVACVSGTGKGVAGELGC